VRAATVLDGGSTVLGEVLLRFLAFTTISLKMMILIPGSMRQRQPSYPNPFYSLQRIKTILLTKLRTLGATNLLMTFVSAGEIHSLDGMTTQPPLPW
jgi:hypothetical protein